MITLSPSFQTSCEVDLVPGYLILTRFVDSPRSRRFCLELWDVDTLSLPPAGGRSESTLPPSVISHEVGMPKVDQYMTPRIRLSAHPSPLREGVYTIWVLVRDVTAAIHKFRLSLLEPRKPLLYQNAYQDHGILTFLLGNDWRNFREDYGISYSGHASTICNHLWALGELRHILPLANYMTYTPRGKPRRRWRQVRTQHPALDAPSLPRSHVFRRSCCLYPMPWHCLVWRDSLDSCLHTAGH